MLYIGSHVSLKGKDMYLGSVLEALSYNANSFMVYTGAPQNTIRKSIEDLKIAEALKLIEENNILPSNIIVHAPYIVNLSTEDEEKRQFAISFLTNEVLRTAKMGSYNMVVHPGNALKLSLNEAIKNTAFVLNKIIENTKDVDVRICIETMAGKGSEIGKTFEEVKQIIDLIDNKDRIGVCFDTCHVNDSGYDLVNNYEEVITKFDQLIGLEQIKVIHLNDSKNVCGAKKDRHENLGMGNIGFDTLIKICYDERFKNIPKILETPYIDGVAPYKDEIAMIRSKIFKK